MLVYFQVCNGNQYLLIHPSEMQQAWRIRMEQLSQGQGHDKAYDNKNSSSLKDSSPEKLSHLQHRHKQSSQQGKYTLKDLRADKRSGNFDPNLEYDHLDFSTLCVGEKQAALQVETLPEGMLDKVDLFYVCSTCGKVFWEGSHFECVSRQFSHVIKTDSSVGSNAEEDLEIIFE